MQTVIRLTTRETAEAIQRQHGGKPVGTWKLRRVIDDLESKGLLSVQRAGTYRTIADTDLHIIADELRRLGYLENEVAAC